MVQCLRCGTAQNNSATSCSICGTTMNRSSIPAPNTNSLAKWEDRTGSIFISLWNTTFSIIKHPSAFFTQVSNRSKLGSAVLFYVIISLIILPVTMIYDGFSSITTETGNSISAILLEHGLFFVLGIGGIFLGAAFLHLLFAITGVKKAPFKTTATANCYCNAPLIFMLIPIPFVPIFVSAIWAFVLQIISMATVHKCPVGKMAMIQIVPVAILTVLMVLLVIIIAMVVVAAGISLTDTLGIQEILDLIR